MKVKLITDERTYKLNVTPQDTAVDVPINCPHCDHHPLRVSGTDKRIAPDDRAYIADAISVCCSKHVGTLRLETNTLFGLREDEAVLKGRCRVY